jgi:hypothetical protein
MAKTRPRTRVTTIKETLPAASSSEVNLANEPDISQLGDDEMDAIEKLRGMGSGNGYTCAVYRVAQRPGDKAGYCQTYDLADLSPDVIRETHGGGRYRLKLKDSVGRFVPDGSDMMDIMEIAKPGAATVPVATPAAAAPLETLDGIAKIAALFKPGTSDGGMAAMIPLILGMMSTQAEMFKSMMSRPSNELKIADIIALVKSNEKEGGGAFEALLKGLELGRGLGGDGGTDWMGLGKTALESLPQLFAQSRQAAIEHEPDPAARPKVALPAPKPGDATAQPKGAEKMGVIEKLNWLKQQVNMLVHQAARNSNPQLYAALVMDNLPPFITEDEILKRMQEPDCVAQLAALDGRVANHAAWFEAFRLEVISDITEDEGDDEQGGEGEAGAGEGAPGDAG